jgi:hypothetical protein
MSELKAQGVVHIIGQKVQVTDKVAKRTMSISIPDKYPQFVEFEAINDRCSIFDGLQKGDNVDVHFNLRGREWKDKTGVVRVFTTLNAWKVEKVGAQQNTSQPKASKQPVEQSQDDDSEDGDNLPF